MGEDVCPLPGVAQDHPFPLLPLCLYGEVAKALPVVRLLVSVDAVVGLEILVTTLADKRMATVLPNCVLVRRLT